MPTSEKQGTVTVRVTIVSPKSAEDLVLRSSLTAGLPDTEEERHGEDTEAVLGPQRVVHEGRRGGPCSPSGRRTTGSACDELKRILGERAGEPGGRTRTSPWPSWPTCSSTRSGADEPRRTPTATTGRCLRRFTARYGQQAGAAVTKADVLSVRRELVAGATPADRQPSRGRLKPALPVGASQELIRSYNPAAGSARPCRERRRSTDDDAGRVRDAVRRLQGPGPAGRTRGAAADAGPARGRVQARVGDEDRAGAGSSGSCQSTRRLNDGEGRAGRGYSPSRRRSRR